jgi:hypothetical protein
VDAWFIGLTDQAPGSAPTEIAMSKKAKGSEKLEAKNEAFDALRAPKPRSAIIDFMVFIGGVGSLVWVFTTIAPN